jgi:hypothetical protein
MVMGSAPPGDMVRSHGIDDAKLNEPVAEQSCASFEVWFLDLACSQLHHAKKVARTKQRLAHKASK